MKKGKTQRFEKSKDAKINKLKNKKEEIDIDKLPMNYFRLRKEIEKENLRNKLQQDLKLKPNPEKKEQETPNKKSKQNINELIYNKYSKAVSKYYDKNQDNITLIGSSKYEELPINEVVKDISKSYKERVVENNKSLNEIKNKDYDRVKNYINCLAIATLTPLADNEKDKNDMNDLEKKKFDESQRMTKRMRLIEISKLINNKTDFEQFEQDKIFLKKKVDIIEKFWLKLKQRRKARKERNESLGNIEIQYLGKKNKELEELIKKYNELEKKYEEIMQEKNKKEKEYIIQIDEINLNNNELKKKNGKYIDELKKLKRVNENLIKEKKEKDDNLQNLENNNTLLKNQILNLNEEFNNLKKTKALTDIENENKIKSIKKNFDKEKKDLNKILDELKNEIKEKIKEIEEQNKIMKEYEDKTDKIKKEKKKKNKKIRRRKKN